MKIAHSQFSEPVKIKSDVSGILNTTTTAQPNVIQQQWLMAHLLQLHRKSCYTLIFIAILGCGLYPTTSISVLSNPSISSTCLLNFRVGNGFGVLFSWTSSASTWSLYTCASPSWIINSWGAVPVTWAIICVRRA